MDEVKVKKEELLIRLRTNKESHQQLYKDAMEGFWVDSEKKLRKALEKIGKSETPSTISFSVPVDHTEQYEEAIAMLEMSIEDEVLLTRSEFNSYVLDRWVSESEKHLMRAFAMSSSNASAYK